jgi:outer membrane receptor protein involved in Fe transport
LNAADADPTNNCSATPETDAAISLGYVYRRTVEAGPRIDQQNTNMFDFKAGVTWNITRNINFDLYGAYGESNIQQRRLNYIAKSRVQQALNASNPDTCDVTAGGCVPLNLFGPPGSITPAMAGFIGGVTSVIDRGATLAQVHGVISGDFGWQLPWASAPISFAVGGEHRDYTAYTRPDNLAQQPGELGGAGGAILPIEGGYTAEDAFGELIVPIAADRPFFQQLTLEAGYRRSHYVVDAAGKPSFNANTYKIGGTWAPIDALKFRANYQQAVRAPNVSELFAPVATGLIALATDPCAGTLNPALVTPTLPLNPNLANPNLVAVCLAQGAPAGAIGAIQNPAAGQANATGGGNPNLKPETAHTWTVGAVITPRSILPGFNATIDYYNIKIKDAITVPTSGDIIAACFGDATGSNVSAGAATSPACTAIRRGGNGRLSGSVVGVPGLPAPLTNSGILKTDGFDLTANYRHGLGMWGADLILNFSGNYTRHSSLQASVTAPTPPNCAGVYSTNCGTFVGQLQPKWSWNQRTTLSFKPLDVSLLWRHISGFHYQTDLAQLGRNCAGPEGTAGVNGCTITGTGPFVGKTINLNRIPAFDYFDLSSRFSITDHFDLTLTAFNIFDKQPPIVGAQAGTTTANSGNTFPTTYDALGRRYGASVRLKF